MTNINNKKYTLINKVVINGDCDHPGLYKDGAILMEYLVGPLSLVLVANNPENIIYPEAKTAKDINESIIADCIKVNKRPYYSLELFTEDGFKIDEQLFNFRKYFANYRRDLNIKKFLILEKSNPEIFSFIEKTFNINQKTAKIIDSVLEEGQDEFINKVYDRFINKRECYGEMMNPNLFDIITAYHDGETSVTTSKIIDGETFETLYYNDFTILLTAEGGLNIVFTNTGIPLQPCLVIPEISLDVEKVSVTENVGLDRPSITIIANTKNKETFCIAMRTTNLIINKNMEVK